jgi:hypothetical protein
MAFDVECPIANAPILPCGRPKAAGLFQWKPVHSAAKSPSLVYVLLDRDDLLRVALLQRIKKFFGVRTHGEVRHQMLNGYRG